MLALVIAWYPSLLNSDAPLGRLCCACGTLRCRLCSFLLNICLTCLLIGLPLYGSLHPLLTAPYGINRIAIVAPIHGSNSPTACTAEARRITLNKPHVTQLSLHT